MVVTGDFGTFYGQLVGTLCLSFWRNMLSGAINKSESDPTISIVADVSQSPFLVPCQVLVYFYVLEESRSSKGGNKNSYRRRRRCSSERDEALTKRKRTKSHLSPQKRRVQEFLDKSCLSLPPFFLSNFLFKLPWRKDSGLRASHTTWLCWRPPDSTKRIYLVLSFSFCVVN